MTSFEHRKLGFGRVDHTNETARGRGKQNIAYEDPSGKQFFAKYVDLAGGEHYAVEALQHEQAMLRRLADTGVTPKAGEIKFYPNREAPQKARLLIEYLPGTSLDQGVDKDHPTETIQATALALSRLHRAGVLLVDVNPGAFLVRPQDGNPTTANIVDVEMALDLYQLDGLRRADFLYREHDLGYYTATSEMTDDEEAPAVVVDRVKKMKRSEINLWGRAMADWLLGPPQHWSRPTLSTTDELVSTRLARRLTLPLRDMISPNIFAVVEDMIESGKIRPDQGRTAAQRLFDREFPLALERELLPVTLVPRLQQAGIPLEPRVQDFLLKTLDPTIEQRPIDFSGLGV